MTDDEIIKAWNEEIHLANYVNEDYRNGIEISLIENTLDLINRQKAEIKRLTELLEGWKTEAYKVADEKDKLYCEAVERVKATKAEAIKEFAERIDTHFEGSGIHWLYEASLKQRIDNLVKEMTEPSLLDKKFGGDTE